MYDLDGIPPALLTTGNPKTAKGEGHGYLTAILHLAPASLSGRNVCPHASAGCIAACLNTAGQGGINLDENGLNRVQAARIRRTRFFQRDRPGFMTQLVDEFETHVRRARKYGLIPAGRPNGTSDLPWERFPCERNGVSYPHIFAAFPEVQFYDYTKWPLNKRRVAGIENYHLTFSLSERADSVSRAADYLAGGHGVAVVFDVLPAMGFKKVADPLPERYLGARVIDGDATDLRFRDPAGVIVGLRAKGRARRDTSGFVRHA